MIELATLGVVELKDGEGHTLEPLLAQPKRLALLIYLALGKPQGVHRRDSVVAVFWPELDQEHARAALRQAVRFLRSHLGEGVVLGRTEEELAVGAAALRCDVRAFEEACETGRPEDALRLYRGEFLEGFHISDVAPEFEQWVDAERGRLRQRAAAAAWGLAERERSEGDGEAAAEWARRGAYLAGDDEAQVRRLIRFLDALGDRAGALHVYGDFVARLRAEFDAEPAAETRALLDELRSREIPGPLRTAPSRVAPPAPGLGGATTRPVARSARRNVRGALARAGAVGVVAALGVALGRVLLIHHGAPITVVRTTRLTTQQGMAFDPALSPDGRFLAYAAGELGGETGIYVRQIGGGGAISLTPGRRARRGVRWPRWSRDGAWMAYESAGEIDVVSALGGGPRRLAQGVFPAWSPDGRRLVFIRADTLFALALEASIPKPLTTAFEPGSPAWSPDGSRIAYVVGNNNYRDGNVVPSAIWILDLATGAAAPVTDTQYVNQSPVWVRDGSALLYVSNRDGSRDVYRLPLDRAGVPGGPSQRVTVGAGVWTISAAADGQLVAYSVFGESNDVWAFALRSGPGRRHLSDGRRVTRAGDVSFFDLSPDGRWLAWHGNGMLYKQDMITGDVAQLADGAMVPAWSPDDRQIAFYKFRDGSRDIFVMSADGRNQRALTRNVTHEYAPDWSPDGRSLVFSSTVGQGSAPTEVYVVSTPDSNTGAWSAPRLVSANGAWAPRWSPDGRFIAFARGRRWEVAPSAAEIAVVTPDGTDDRVLARVPIREPHPNWVAWSPDSRRVHYLAADTEGAVSLWAVPVTGGAPRRLMSFDRDLDLGAGFDLYRDTLYLRVGRGTASISLLELSR